jgi:acetyl-CoA C-acetyltransferase
VEFLGDGAEVAQVTKLHAVRLQTYQLIKNGYFRISSLVATVEHMGIEGTDIVICEPIRTPVGRMGGALASLTVNQLATAVLTELVRRTGLGEGDIDDVILGLGYSNGESPALGRIAALDAGLGTGVPGLQVDRRCGSGLQAVLYGAAQVATGGAGLVVAGGAG